MFGLLKSQPFVDPQVGKLVRSRGLWRGSINVGSTADVPLAVAGTRSAPDPTAIAAARDVATQFQAWRPAIELALFGHYEPYAAALAAGELPHPTAPFPKLSSPSHIWPHVSLVFVSVEPLSGMLTTELGYTTAWDEEHTLGARFQAGKLIELCGSTVPS